MEKANVKLGQYICQHADCTARFHQIQHLKTHAASHEGIKPFKCNFEGCDQTFTQKGNLKVSTSLFILSWLIGVRHIKENILERNLLYVKNVIKHLRKRAIYKLIKAYILALNRMYV
jgi:hypothetical protein